MKIISKYVTFCGRLYDKVFAFWSGKHEQTPESIQRSQVRGTWIVSLFIAFSIIGAFTEDEENCNRAGEEITTSVGTEASSDVEISKLGKPKSFKKIAVGENDLFIWGADDGVAFYIKSGPEIISVTDEGVLVSDIASEMILGKKSISYVKTDDSGYVDGDFLKKGVYVRRGTYRYSSDSGAVKTVPAFEKVTREKDVKIFMSMYEREKAKIKGNSK